MKSFYFYITYIAVLLVSHIYGVLLTLLSPLHIYITMVASLIILAFMIKKAPIETPNWSSTVNQLLTVIQLILLILNLIQPSLYVSIALFLSFILLEYARNVVNNETKVTMEELKTYEASQTHFNETFKVVRSERHDFLKHVSAIHYMLEKNEFHEAKAYVDSIVDGYEETNLSIKGETGVVASVLHETYKRAKKLNVSIHYELDVPLSTIPLLNKEKLSLISNLLANALEACEDWQKEREERPMLKLQFYKRSGLYILVCTNSALPIPVPILDQLYTEYGMTTKTGTHEGLGTKIIHSIVQNHGGLLDFTFKEEQFLVKIKIPAIK